MSALSSIAPGVGVAVEWPEDWGRDRTGASPLPGANSGPHSHPVSRPATRACGALSEGEARDGMSLLGGTARRPRGSAAKWIVCPVYRGGIPVNHRIMTWGAVLGVEKNPRLQPAWDIALQDDVLTWPEANVILESAGEKAEPDQ